MHLNRQLNLCNSKEKSRVIHDLRLAILKIIIQSSTNVKETILLMNYDPKTSYRYQSNYKPQQFRVTLH